MSMTKIKTAVAAPEEARLQPGDLVTTVRPERIWFGRVFDVGESTVRVWWSGIAGLPAVEGLTTHQMDEVRFVDRPLQYVAVMFETPEGDAYHFVSAGDDVTSEESAFELAPRYAIISRRTTKTPDTTITEDHDDDKDSHTGR